MGASSSRAGSTDSALSAVPAAQDHMAIPMRPPAYGPQVNDCVGHGDFFRFSLCRDSEEQTIGGESLHIKLFAVIVDG